jgi:hypothetical protein
MAVAVLFGEQQGTEQVNRVVSSMHQACPLYPNCCRIAAAQRTAASGHVTRLEIIDSVLGVLS